MQFATQSTAIITAITAVVMTVLNETKVMDYPAIKDNIPTITLFCVFLIALNLALEHSPKLYAIEKAVSANSIDVKLFPNTEEGMEYMAKRVISATKKIDHAALATSVIRRKSYAERWEKSILSTLRTNKVEYNYIASLEDGKRWERISKHLRDKQIERYNVRYYTPGTESIPAISFIIIDESEIIMHYPYRQGKSEKFYAIKEQGLVELFKQYYEILWDSAHKIPGRDVEKAETAIIKYISSLFTTVQKI
jgi:hypothetical protein